MGTVEWLRDRSIRVAVVGAVIAGAGAAAGMTLGTTSTAEPPPRVTVTTRSGGTGAETEPWEGGTGPLVGETFPDLTGVGIDGRAISTKSRDRPLVVVVWDSRCRCSDLFVAANAADLQRDDAVGVVGVNLDTNLSKAAQTNLDSGLLFPSMTDRGGDVLRLTGPIPRGALLVVEPDGTIVADYRDGVDAAAFARDLAEQTS